MANPFDERARSIPGIVIDLIGQFTTLLRQESQLARAEISENINRVLMGVVMAVTAAVLLLPALVILLMAAVFGLEAAGLASYWAALIVGGVAAVAAATTPIMRNFQEATRKAPITENTPFFAATAATPPPMRAARPYSATLSPLRQSA